MKRAPRRFYLPIEISPAGKRYESAIGHIVALSREESHHLKRVLRLREGDGVELFDAAGAGYLAEVTEAGNRHNPATLRITEQIAEAHEDKSRGPEVHIALAIVKHRAMDWLIEKLSELGVASLQPLITERTVAADRAAAESPERWTRLAIAAAKQCGRNRPLVIKPPEKLEVWLDVQISAARESEGKIIHNAFAHFGAGSVPLALWSAETNNSKAVRCLAIGCEGGWTDDESSALEAAGFQRVALGSLTLRAETAAIAGAALLLLG